MNVFFAAMTLDTKVDNLIRQAGGYRIMWLTNTCQKENVHG